MAWPVTVTTTAAQQCPCRCVTGAASWCAGGYGRVEGHERETIPRVLTALRRAVPAGTKGWGCRGGGPTPTTLLPSTLWWGRKKVVLPSFAKFELTPAELSRRVCTYKLTGRAYVVRRAEPQCAGSRSEHAYVLGTRAWTRLIRAHFATICTLHTSLQTQHWYYCYTCNLTGAEGCCSICARVCHKGHDVRHGPCAGRARVRVSWP